MELELPPSEMSCNRTSEKVRERLIGIKRFGSVKTISGYTDKPRMNELNHWFRMKERPIHFLKNMRLQKYPKMEVKILRTLNTICLNFSPFPPSSPSNVVVCVPCSLYPVLKVFVYPNIVWNGEGRGGEGRGGEGRGGPFVGSKLLQKYI